MSGCGWSIDEDNAYRRMSDEELRLLAIETDENGDFTPEADKAADEIGRRNAGFARWVGRGVRHDEQGDSTAD